MANIAFFGTPSFSVPSLQELHKFCDAYNHRLSFVVCPPDKQIGRGLKYQICPVKKRALDLEVTVIQPQTLRLGTQGGDDLRKEFLVHGIDLAVVVAYGKIVPDDFLKMAQFGFVNVHASLLPRWRGAAPIQRAIETGDDFTGISIMDLEPEMDTGPVYLLETVKIEDSDDTASLSEKLSFIGASTLAKALPGILNRSLAKIPQPTKGITYAKMVKKSEGQIEWDSPSKLLINKIRAMTPWPGSFTTYHEKTISLFRPFVTEWKDSESTKTLPGSVIYAGNSLMIACADGAISFTEAQLEGKRRMTIKELLNGFPIKEGTRLGM